MKNEYLILMAALRYAFSRQTYMPSVVADGIVAACKRDKDQLTCKQFIDEINKLLQTQPCSNIEQITWRDCIQKLLEIMHA